MGRDEQAGVRGDVRRAPGVDEALRDGPRRVREGLLRRRRPPLPRQGAGDHGEGVALDVRLQHVPAAGDRGGADGLRARLHGPGPVRLQGDGEEHGRAELVHVRAAQPGPQAGAHRRDELRGRDQEVDILGAELRAPPAGRAPHALLGQRGRRRREHGRVLRPVGHGEDDVVCRPVARAHRRRRARVVRRGRVQLRGRLLRQGHPPERGGRARNLRDDARVRDAGRERRAPARPHHRLRRLHDHGEHAAELPHLVHPQRERGRHGRACPRRSCS